MTFWNKNMTYHESYSSSNINILIICILDLKIDIVINFYITEKEGDLQLFISGSNIDGYSSQIIYIYTPAPRRGRGYTVLFLSVCPSFRPSKIFFSVTVDGRNLIFGHKHHIGIPYCGKRFWTHQIPTSCLPT